MTAIHLSPIRDLADMRRLDAVDIASAMPGRNVLDVIRRVAATHADRIAIRVVDPAAPSRIVRELSYAQFQERVRQLGLGLRRLAGRKTVVTHLLPICPEAYLTMFAGAGAGGVNPINGFLEQWQIARLMEEVESSILIAPGPEMDPEVWAKAVRIRETTPCVEHLIGVGGGVDPDLALAFDEIGAGAENDGKDPADTLGPDDIVCYMHTGGTTGMPKMVQHTHRMHLAQFFMTGAAMAYRPGDVVLAGAPLFHVGGAMVGGAVPLSHGATILISSKAGFRDKETRENIWRIVEAQRVTSFVAVPTVLSALIGVPIANDVSSLRFIASGGSPVPPKLSTAIEEKIGCRVHPAFGMTEVGSYVIYPPRDGDWPAEAIGLAMPHVEVRIVEIGADGEPSRDCAIDEIGVLLLRGPAIMPGYVRDAHNAGVMLKDGWLNSGDLGRIDASGMIFLTGRAKDLIIRGAHNIDPMIIEDVLYQHPAVELAAAIGKPDAYAGELPVAYVQFRAGSTAAEEELKGFVRARIAERAANPVSIFTIAAMPQTTYGKIFKPTLRYDAIKRAYEEALAPLVADGQGRFDVTVGPSDTHGTLVNIAYVGPGELADVEKAIAGLLAKFSIRYELHVEASPAADLRDARDPG